MEINIRELLEMFEERFGFLGRPLGRQKGPHSVMKRGTNEPYLHQMCRDIPGQKPHRSTLRDLPCPTQEGQERPDRERPKHDGEAMIIATLFLAYCLMLGIGGYIGEKRGWWQ